MSGTQTIVLTLAVIIFGGGSLFYFSQANKKVASNANCRAAATTMPLVNTTTGMGMSVAVAEC
jgi:multidrug resistance efflux pump